VALEFKLVSDEAVTKGWIVTMGVSSRVDEHGIVVVTPRHRVALPFVEPLG